MSNGRDDHRLWDTRTLDRRIRKGHITRKDVEKHQKGLSDASEKGAAVVLAELFGGAADHDRD